MLFNCPGSQHFKAPYPESIKCVFCGSEAEIWSDESQALCGDCGKMLPRNGGQCCLDWCKYARECVGPEKYAGYLKRMSIK